MRKIPQRGSQAPSRVSAETDMAAVLEHYGATYQHKHGWQKLKCLVHNDSTPSMTVDVDTGAFSCHACGAKGGDALALIRLIEECDFPTTIKKYEEITGAEWAGKVKSSGQQESRRVSTGQGFRPRFSRPRRPTL